MLPHNIMFYYPYNKTMTGGPRVLLSLIELLDKNKFRPLVLTQAHSPLVVELKKRNIEVLVLQLPGILNRQDGQVLKYGIFKLMLSFIYLIKYNITVYSLLKNRHIRIIWARNIKAVLFVGIGTLFTRTKLVWDIGLGDGFKGMVKLLHVLGINISDLVVTEGKSQHEIMFGKIIPSLYKNRLINVLPGIEQERVKFIKSLKKSKNTSPFKIISVASISPRKNQKMLLLVLEKLIAGYPQVHVTFVGAIADEEYHQQLHLFIKNAGLSSFVTFLGWRDDIPELLHASNLLVLCSYNEGIPQAIVESMHAGLPVVATKVGGVPDAVIENETGFMVEVDDIEEMYSKIKYLINNAEVNCKMGENGKVFAQQNFTFEAYYEKYDAIFSDLIDKK